MNSIDARLLFDAKKIEVESQMTVGHKKKVQADISKLTLHPTEIGTRIAGMVEVRFGYGVLQSMYVIRTLHSTSTLEAWYFTWARESSAIGSSPYSFATICLDSLSDQRQEKKKPFCYSLAIGHAIR